jgi:hypothetical protein
MPGRGDPPMARTRIKRDPLGCRKIFEQKKDFNAPTIWTSTCKPRTADSRMPTSIWPNVCSKNTTRSSLDFHSRARDLKLSLLRAIRKRRLQFQKGSQLFIGTYNEPLSVVAMCVCNEDRSPVGIHGCNAAPTPTGFAEIVSDFFPVLHAHGLRVCRCED